MSVAVDNLLPFGAQLPTVQSIEETVGIAPRSLDDDQLTELVRQLTECVARVTAAQVEAVREADRRDLARTRTLRTTANWLAVPTGIDPERSSMVARRGRQLDRMPRVADAFGSGKLTEDHVRVLGGVHTDRTAAAFARDETMLVDFAIKLPWREFTDAVRYWAFVNDFDGTEPVEPPQQE